VQPCAAHQAVDRFERGKCLPAYRAQFGKPARLWQELTFKGSNGAVVGIDCCAEFLSAPLQVPYEAAEAAVQILAQIEDFRRVLGDRRLPPAIGYRLEKRN
jgi:hypothetical protein